MTTDTERGRPVRNGTWRWVGWYGATSHARTYGVLVSEKRVQIWYGQRGITIYWLPEVARRAGAHD
jgi:hypothetical protein